VTTAPLTADELGRLVDSLLQRTSLIELAVVAGCLLLAWLTVRFLRSADTPSHSVWFGAHVIDGVLFPVLALVFAVAARWALKDVVPLVIFRLVVPVFTSLLVIRLTVRVLHNAFPTSKLMRVVERSVSWLAWIAVVLWILGVLPLVLGEMEAIRWRIGATQISLRDLIEGLLTGVIVLVIALWLSAAIEQKLLKDATDDLSVRKIAANAVRAAMLFIGLMFALSAAGIDLTALGVLGGALGVGIGFGLQKLAANYVSGFVILAERSVRIGDMVRIDNFEGRITDINTRYTVIRALNGRESIVPNEMLITQRVENSSLADRSVAASTTVQVAYGTDLETLMPRLAAAVSEVPRILRDPGPAVFLSAFASDGLELTVSFWIADPENGQLGPRSAANMVILRVLNDAGVEIPYPQRVLRRA
jgi:small-conductance mechanosensitive channel